MGLSRIKIVVEAAQGGIGPTGATGPTGNTGAYVTGPDGPGGYGLSSVVYNPSTDGITFTFENSLSAFFTGIKGNTGFNPPFPEIGYTGTGVRFLSNINPGSTLFFKGISFSSGISASIVSNTIFIENNAGETGSLTPNKLVNVKYNTPQPKYYLSSSENANYKDVQYSGVSYSSLNILQRTPRDLLDFNNFNYSTGSTQGVEHAGLTLGINAAFYGITGMENDPKISTWTPYIRYRTDYSDVNGTSGVTVGTIKFGKIGPFNKTIQLGTTLGSCCFCNDSVQNPDFERMCKDYVNKDYCDSMLGRFSTLSCDQRLDTYDCYRKRACCVNGRCVNTSLFQCDKVRGAYFPEKICGVSFNCEIQTAAAVDTNEGCCCRDGIPVYVADPGLCNGPLLPPGQQQDCAEIQCCGSTGACCLPNGTCVSGVTPEACVQQDGIYRGRVPCSSGLCV